MEHVDFMHLLRLSEQACESDAKGYRRSVWWFAVLGYAVVIVLALVAVGVLGAVAWAVATGRPGGWMIWLGLVALALLWVTVRALMTRFPAPEGYRVTPEDAPELFKAIERLRRAVKGPPIDEVVLDASFNAAILQRPRLGWLGHTNHLIIGWPLMCALEPRRLLAVIAHEYGHLRGEHGKFSAWIYRTRSAWWRLQQSYEADEGPVPWLVRGFLSWYVPRFNARTFALARQDEYEADRVAARLCRPEVVGQAWVEIEIKSRWYHEVYWPRQWQRAQKEERPDPMPHADMASGLLHGPDEAYATRALREALARLPSYDDTHPVPRDRLVALGVRPEVPTWSKAPSIALLGRAAPLAARHFDRQWWQDTRRDWEHHHRHLRTCRDRARDYRARAADLQADEWVDWAECLEQLGRDDHAALYEQALEREPGHARALLRLTIARQDTTHHETLVLAERLQARHPQHGYAACRLALDHLDRLDHTGSDLAPRDPAVRRTWRERLTHFEKLEATAWESVTATNPCEHLVGPDWTELERRYVIDELIRLREVSAAWVGGKTVPELPGRVYLVLFIQMRRTDEARGHELVQQLMESLPFPGRLLVTVVDLFVREADVRGSAAQAFYRRQRSR